MKRALLLLAITLAMVGCGVTKKVKMMFAGELQIEVYVDQELNQNSALAVDLLVIYDKKLAEEVLELSARQWFARKAQFERDHPKGHDIRSWEWVPGQLVPPQTLELKSGAETGVIFADYLAPGTHREQIDPRQHLVLRLASRNFKVEPQE